MGERKVTRRASQWKIIYRQREIIILLECWEEVNGRSYVDVWGTESKNSGKYKVTRSRGKGKQIEGKKIFSLRQERERKKMNK